MPRCSTCIGKNAVFRWRRQIEMLCFLSNSSHILLHWVITTGLGHGFNARKKDNTLHWNYYLASIYK